MKSSFQNWVKNDRIRKFCFENQNQYSGVLSWQIVSTVSFVHLGKYCTPLSHHCPENRLEWSKLVYYTQHLQEIKV